jgi:CheY-like chemotaxis protein
VCYEKLLPGSQLVNGLHDMGYRVRTLADVRALPGLAAEEKPLIVLADLEAEGMCEAIAKLKKDTTTAHLPIIAFADGEKQELQAAGRAAGATLVVDAGGLLLQLKQLLDQALMVE